MSIFPEQASPLPPEFCPDLHGVLGENGTMHTQRGFSLLETTAFGAVIAMVATGILSALPGVMAANHQAHLLQQSNALLRHVQAEMSEVGWENLVALDGAVLDHEALQGSPVEDLTRFEARLSMIEVSTTMRQVRVDIIYLPPSHSGSERERLMASGITRRARR
ncbi:MAG: type II secretion system protein [Planctomycetes bacterium]|nr:type II secretion system protein [Planctomycetota bacterium]